MLRKYIIEIEERSPRGFPLTAEDIEEGLHNVLCQRRECYKVRIIREET